MMKNFTRAAVLAVVTMAACPVWSQNLTAADPNAVMSAMQAEGFLVTQDKADDGTPRLTSKISSSEFRVYFYGCEESDPCTSVQFSARYDLDNALSAAKMNQWNTENRYARALIDDDGDPYLRMDLAMTGDGMGTKNFAEVLDLWRLLVEDFEKFIDW